jgi:hypothetical protein
MAYGQWKKRFRVQGPQEKANAMVFMLQQVKCGGEPRRVPRNRLSINLPDGLLHGNHIAA